MRGKTESSDQIGEPSSKRPMGISVLAVFLIIFGIFMLLVGIGNLGYTFVPGYGWFAIPFLIFGIMCIAVGRGFWRGARWAWILSITLFIISFIPIVYIMWTGDWWSIIGVIIPVGLIYYLFRPNVKAWFGRTGSRALVKMMLMIN